MGTSIAGIAGAAAVALMVGLAFGLALGLMHAEPKHKSPQLHEGEWGLVGLKVSVVQWQRQEERRKNCHDEHRAFVCTIGGNTAHVDACDCGMTREGVYGQWR